MCKSDHQRIWFACFFLSSFPVKKIIVKPLRNCCCFHVKDKKTGCMSMTSRYEIVVWTFMSLWSLTHWCWQWNNDLTLYTRGYFATYKCTESVIFRLLFLRQTAEVILRKNTHCSGTEMVFEPLLRERVRATVFKLLLNIKALHAIQ